MKLEKTIVINKPLPGYKVGEEVKIPVDEYGTPKDQYWRRRVRDSKIDNCIETKEIPDKKTGTSQKKTKPSKGD